MMMGQTKVHQEGPNFTPNSKDNEWLGKRRAARLTAVDPSTVIGLRWPKDIKQRREMFNQWYSFTIKILVQNKLDTILLSAIQRWLFVGGNGEPNLDKPDHWLAERLHCSKSKIQRLLDSYEAVGVICRENENKLENGRWKRVRYITLSLPTKLPENVQIGDDDGDDSLTRGHHQERR